MIKKVLKFLAVIAGLFMAALAYLEYQSVIIEKAAVVLNKTQDTPQEIVYRVGGGQQVHILIHSPEPGIPINKLWEHMHNSL